MIVEHGNSGNNGGPTLSFAGEGNSLREYTFLTYPCHNSRLVNCMQWTKTSFCSSSNVRNNFPYLLTSLFKNTTSEVKSFYIQNQKINQVRSRRTFIHILSTIGIVQYKASLLGTNPHFITRYHVFIYSIILVSILLNIIMKILLCCIIIINVKKSLTACTKITYIPLKFLARSIVLIQ